MILKNESQSSGVKSDKLTDGAAFFALSVLKSKLCQKRRTAGCGESTRRTVLTCMPMFILQRDDSKWIGANVSGMDHEGSDKRSEVVVSMLYYPLVVSQMVRWIGQCLQHALLRDTKINQSYQSPLFISATRATQKRFGHTIKAQTKNDCGKVFGKEE